MKIRKLIKAGLVFAMSMAVAGTVNAEGFLPVDISGNVLRIEIENPYGNRIFSTITKSGAELSDSNLFGAYETDGDILEFIMPDFRDGVDGEYTLYVSGKNVGSFCYASEESREKATEALEDDGADFESIISAESEYYYPLVVLGYDMDGFENADAKDDVIAFFEESGVISADSFNKAVAVVLLDENADVSDVLEKVNPVFEKTAYNDADENVKKWIVNYIEKSRLDSVEEFDREYAVSNILYLIDNAKFSQLEKLFDKYEKELGLDSDSNYEDYKELSNSKQDKVHDYIVTKFSKSDCTSSDILKDVLEDAVDSLGKGSSGGSGGGGGGGGSSSGSSGNNFFFPTTDDKKEPEVTPVQPPVQSEGKFNDLSEAAWATEAILALSEKGIVAGDGNGSFNPNDSVTREQFVKMLVLAAGIEVNPADNIFADVNSSEWYAQYVLSAYKDGIVLGVSDTEFGIGSLIKRQDMAVMAYRTLKGKDLADVRELNSFADSAEISDYAVEAVNKLYTSGVISGMGDNNFNPGGTATRAESAMIIYNLFVK